jgi:hypothetical protein
VESSGVMAVRSWLTPRRARYALGVSRLINGSLALAAPARLVKTFGEDPADNGAALYALRLFGVRTVVLGLQLLLADDDALPTHLQYAVWIHASDTTSAATALVRHELPARAALTGTVLSSLNTLFAVTARRALRP